MLKVITFIAIVLLCIESKSNSYLYSRFLNSNSCYFNPSLTGLDKHHFGILGQKQWVGINNSPYLIAINTDIRLGMFDFYNPTMMLNKSNDKGKGRVGLGANLFMEKQGAVEILGTHLNYAYHINKQNFTFSQGILINYSKISINTDELDPASSYDPILNNMQLRDNYFNLGIGCSINSKKYTVGLSVTNLLKNYLSDGIGLDFYYNPGVIANLNVRYSFIFNNLKVNIRPVINYSKKSSILYTDVEMAYKNNLYFNIDYQTHYNVLGVGLKYTLRKYYIKYSINTPVGKNKISSYGTNVISLGRDINFSTN